MSVPFSTTATPRPSNLTVPATQNTAPVIKFRCLFTHDMRRKAKRWQDGFLRYHTFNKRVMVYDNTGYFIGDLHWRAPGGIQDGDELELDKGVLIQVCEPLEKTETDISSLYKNKSQPSSSRLDDVPPSPVRSTSRPLFSQRAPRSLNDLLGIRKSTPQVRSQCEQRNSRQASTHQVHERPAKRQRTSPEHVSRPVQDAVDLYDPPSRRRSPDAGTRPEPLKSQPTTALPELGLLTASSAAIEPPQPPSNRPTTQSGPQNPKSASSGSGTSVNTLRLASSNPRKKLIYQEIPAPVQRPLPRNQLSRSVSQHQPPMKHETSSSVIMTDDDPLDAQPIVSRLTTRDKVEPYPLSTSNNKVDLSSRAIKPPSSDKLPQTPQLSNFSVQQPSRATSQRVKPSGTVPKPLSPGLHKSYSDPTTLNSRSHRPLATTSSLGLITEQSDEHEQGPWTSEALDLFDFWPPGRPKPP